MTPEDDDLLGRIEADQSMILKFIEDSRRLCEKSEALVTAAKRKRSKEAEGETEDA